ncbi:MAG: immunoglobulin domain-containing protein, partial [Oscillospiraceae bacterium]|nr:immunoglobulin domain-containing protein [Oscillospiraceae bacterium]
LSQSGNRPALYLFADTVITGPGKLRLMALRDIGIYVVNSRLTIKDTTVEANPYIGTRADYGITGDSQKSALVITNSTVIAAGSNGGICDFTGGLTLNGVSVRTPAGGTVRNGSVWDDRGVAVDVTVEPCGPEITTQPKTVTVSAGTTATFSVAAAGSALTYRWQYATGSIWRNSSLPGCDTASISVEATAARDGQKYRCIVTGPYGPHTVSSAAVLKVKPTITGRPQNVTAKVGDTAKFTVTAAGSNLTYQWQYNNGNGWRNSTLEGCNTATLKVPVAAYRDGQQYCCIVKSGSGASVTSTAATLTVKPAITAQPQSVTAAVGDTAKFTVTATGIGLTYQWQYNNGSGWANSSQSGCRTATLRVPVTAARDGQKYRCIVTSSNGMTVTSSAAAITVKTAITAQPQNVTASAGDTARFTVTATGSGLTYQWQYNTGSGWNNSTQSGCRTATLRVPATAARSGQKYRCVIIGSNDSVVSAAATLTVR